MWFGVTILEKNWIRFSVLTHCKYIIGLVSSLSSHTIQLNFKKINLWIGFFGCSWNDLIILFFASILLSPFFCETSLSHIVPINGNSKVSDCVQHFLLEIKRFRLMDQPLSEMKGMEHLTVLSYTQQ